METTKTLHLRVKDKHTKMLNAQAIEVNQVWNFCVGTAKKAVTPFYGKVKFLNKFKFMDLTSGLSKTDDCTLHSQTIQVICEEVATRTNATKNKKWQIPRFRKSFGSGRALGWIPFKTSAIRYKNGQLHYQNKPISVWDSYGLGDYELRTGCFSQDARGRWYINITVKVQTKTLPKTVPDMTKSIGIDLGCKTAATCSDGTKLDGRWFRELEPKLAIAQRANKKEQVKAIHAKIKNKRNDALHKLTTSLVENNEVIIVGDVSSEKIAKTNMAKSVYDAGWGKIKVMLNYKSHLAGVMFDVVNERYTTQTCSQCGSIEGPGGLNGLGIREWVCSCGAIHDRDVNSAINILARGHARLVAGIHAQ